MKVLTRRVLVENLNYKKNFKNTTEDITKAWMFFNDLGGYAIFYQGGGGTDVYESRVLIRRANEVLEQLKTKKKI